MAYYIRVLSPNPKLIAASLLRRALATSGLKATLSGEDIDDWNQMIATHADGRHICAIEHCCIEENGPGRDEIDEFMEEMDDCLPKTGAAWVASYLASVRTVYSLQILDGAYKDDGWGVVDLLKSKIWNKVGGIFQADGEGFSNDDGYHVVWQFPSSASGNWWVAVLKNGKWIKYQMDLGDKTHREAFFRGEVPAGLDFVD